VPYDDIPAITAALTQYPNIVAILVEPIQGEGGINIPASNYLNQIRELCNELKLLMMLDEIQTGIGRTGKFLAYQHNGIIPDVCTLAKALGNGVPIGACLASGKSATLLTAGSHGSTFGGNPLACSAALAVLETLDQDNLIAMAETKGQAICAGIGEHMKTNKHLIEIRHKGLMIGIELDMPCVELVTMALANGLLINVTQEKVIRLLPPLIMDDMQIKLLVETLAKLIAQFTGQFSDLSDHAA
jgi:acetylornithine aminotransferase